jgi:hypothetical protein
LSHFCRKNRDNCPRSRLSGRDSGRTEAGVHLDVSGATLLFVSKQEIQLRILFREKRPGVWIAQSMDYDLNSQGESLKDALQAFALTFIGQLMLDSEVGRAPFSSLGRPPEEDLVGFDDGESISSLGSLGFDVPAGIYPGVTSAKVSDARVAAA